jgi:hypothetical protein
MAGIPESFNSDEVLPPGTYQATFAELKKSLLVIGDGSSPHWDSDWRLALVSNLEILTKQLWSVGFEEVFIDGSFVENKDRPNDIDGYFDTKIKIVSDESMKKYADQISKLNSLDLYKIWNWDPHSRIPDAKSGKAQLTMWMRYKIELYPHIEGLFSGIKDAQGNNLMFPSAFRQSRRNYIPKGIVQIIP